MGSCDRGLKCDQETTSALAALWTEFLPKPPKHCLNDGWHFFSPLIACRISFFNKANHPQTDMCSRVVRCPDTEVVTLLRYRLRCAALRTAAPTPARLVPSSSRVVGSGTAVVLMLFTPS